MKQQLAVSSLLLGASALTIAPSGTLGSDGIFTVMVYNTKTAYTDCGCASTLPWTSTSWAPWTSSSSSTTISAVTTSPGGTTATTTSTTVTTSPGGTTASTTDGAVTTSLGSTTTTISSTTLTTSPGGTTASTTNTNDGQTTATTSSTTMVTTSPGGTTASTSSTTLTTTSTTLGVPPTTLTTTTTSSISTTKGVTTTSNSASTTTTTTASTTTTTKASTTTTTKASTTTTTTTSSSTTTTTSSSSTTTSRGPVVTDAAYVATVLRHHNIHRLNHSSSALTWSDDLGNAARLLAETCKYGHNTSVGGGNYGQNIGAGYLPINMGDFITGGLYNGEVNHYTYFGGDPDFNKLGEYGHFTAIVWKETSMIGCYTADCTVKGLVDAKTGKNLDGMAPFFSVCNYRRTGNVVGAFGANVLRSTGLAPISPSYGCPSSANCVGAPA